MESSIRTGFWGSEVLAAGDLKHRVVIQSQDATEDGDGQQVLTWTTFATVWADIGGMSGLSTIRSGGDADMSVTRVSIRARWLEGLTAGMRVTHGSDIYDIQAVSYDMATKETVDMVCYKGGSDG